MTARRLTMTCWLAAALLLAMGAIGCTGAELLDMDETVRNEAPLGGEALMQRKHDLDRAYRDLLHFHATLTSLVDRRDSRSISLFDDFLSAYLAEHLDPLLRSEWQSRHAELVGVDASLRFAKAQLLIQMRYPRRVQQTIDDIERRYRGREALLIEYPIGRKGTLGQGLEILRDRKWKG